MRARVVGVVLVPVIEELTADNHRAARALARPPRERAAGSLSPLGHRYGGGPAPPADGQEARIRAHRKRIANALKKRRQRGDDGRRVLCWGPCGRSLPAPNCVRGSGWHSRPVSLGAGAPDVEVHCPACFAAWGWIDV